MNDVEAVFENLLNDRVSKEALSEANDKTIPGGTYKIEIVKKESTTAGDLSPWPGRMIVRLQADAFKKNDDGEYVRRGRLFFDVSPEARRTAKNRLDGPAKLWGNLASVLGNKDSTNREILDAIGQYPLVATVSRPFQKLDKTYEQPQSADREAELFSEGATPRNFVQSLRMFKE